MALDDTPATLLHIGCGYATEWRKSGFPARYARIVLLEPNPACLEDLQALAQADPRVQVIGAALADQDGTADFHLMSFEDLSGLRPVHKLKAMMPGLTEERRMPVRCLSVATLLVEAGLTGAPAGTGPDDGEGGGRDMLILEAMGMESAALRALATAGALPRFSHIRMQLARVPLQASDFDPEMAAAFLAAAGLVMQDPAPDADPDLPQLMFRRDATLTAALVQARALEARLQAAEAKNRHLARQVAEAQEAAKAEVARLTGLLSEKDSGLVAARVAQDSLTARIREMETRIEGAEETLAATHEKLQTTEQETQKFRSAHEAAKAESARQSALVREKTAALVEAQSSGTRLAARVVELEARLATETAEARKLQDDHEARRAEIARQLVEMETRAEAAHETALAEAARPTTLLARKDSALADTQGAKARLEKNLADAQADLRLALRMQAMAGSNLQDLQARYADLLARKDSQDQLIAQLVLRLEEASEHLQTLTLTGKPRAARGSGVLAAPTVEAPPSRHPKGKAGKSKASRA